MKFAAVVCLLFALFDLSLALKDEICSQRPAVVGICLALIRSWSYDQWDNRCFEFIYGGCDGNDNRFRTKEECEAKCKE
ncbi:hypothetical protein KR222_008446 [Zaprionus bogoriensis]|nr:hypothetical protein KR222_008446 [Zaprionus bogoriensis]